MAAAIAILGGAQRQCNVHRDSATRSILSNTSSVSISCSVDTQNALEQDSLVQWQWVRLASDVTSIEVNLGSGNVSGKFSL